MQFWSIMSRLSSGILKHREQVIKWPSIEEWWNISGRIRKAHGFVNCIGLIDGTLFPLAFAPMVNGKDYYTRKGNYAIKGLVICDDAERITWVEMGWPGSVHDNRVWMNSEIYLGTNKYFDQKEYLLGDSAFSASAVMIPAFKKGHNSNLSEEKRFFNTKLSKVRSKSKHCIGLLKAHFQHLWGFQRVIKDKQDLDVILRQAMCACILHNLLIDHPVLPDWFDETLEELDQDDELNQAVEQSSADTRRNQVFAYMLEGR
jgi:DDE superfamily endonuclease